MQLRIRVVIRLTAASLSRSASSFHFDRLYSYEPRTFSSVHRPSKLALLEQIASRCIRYLDRGALFERLDVGIGHSPVVSPQAKEG